MEQLIAHLDPGSLAADVGCGAGRNAIYLAERGHIVYASDLVDLQWIDSIKESSIKQRIHFFRQTVQDFSFPPNHFDAIVLARLIQYVGKKDLEASMARLASSLKPNGFLALSYTAGGGIIDQDQYSFQKFEHSLAYTMTLIQSAGFKTLSLQRGSTQTKYVPHASILESYDIIAEKLP